MNKNTILVSLVFMSIILSSVVSSFELSEETSTVSRIVGESPSEMLRQLQRTELQLDHVTYYTHDQVLNKKDNILEKQFSGNVYTDKFNWGFDDVTGSVNSFGANELFILEAKGEPLQAEAGSDIIEPKYVREWQQSFEDNYPLFMFDAPYAGIYIPKQDSYVSRLVRDSTMIAPSSFSSVEFTKSLLCQLADDKTIGEIYRDARNFHYNGGSKSSHDNLIGLILQSYSLYGNPLQKIQMDWTESDKIQIKEKYCKNYLENLAPNIEFLEQVGNYSKFRKHIVFEIPQYKIDNVNNYSIINATNTFQNYQYGELVLPTAIRTTHFPINTIITDYHIDYVGDYVDLTIRDIPSYEFEFVDRICYDDELNHSIIFENSYTASTQDFIARISPVKVINCTAGTLRLYKKFNYSVDYITLSPALIEDIHAPLSALIDEVIITDIELMKLTSGEVNGSIAIFDQENNILWEQETSTERESYRARFYAPDQEGLQRYSAEFIYENETVNYKEFSIFITILEPIAHIPVTTSLNPDIKINLFSYKNESYDLDARYYLYHDYDTVFQGTFSKTIKEGNNIQQLSFSNLLREKQSYTLTIELEYLGNKKTISYLLHTNNVPIVYIDNSFVVRPGEKVMIDFTAIDYDNDSLTVNINDSRFTKVDDSFVWQTDMEDIGNYTVEIRADDGLIDTKKEVLISVVHNKLPVLEQIDNITVYENDIILVFLYAHDQDNDDLTYYIDDTHFNKTGNNSFEWITVEGDEGNYTTSYSVNDGFDTVTGSFHVSVMDYCEPAWSCSIWSVCNNSIQTRECLDTNGCGTNIGKPDEQISCSITEITRFSDDTIVKQVNYTTKETRTAYIRVPKNVYVTNASMTITPFYLGGSDGEGGTSGG